MNEIILNLPNWVINGFIITIWVFVVFLCLAMILSVIKTIGEIIDNNKFDRYIRERDKRRKRK